MDWILCNECENEFKIISGTADLDEISYCPFCGSDLVICSELDEDDEF